MTRPVVYGSLFSGIGGFDLAFDRVGMQCAWQVEIDKHAQSILRRHWPDVPKFDDIRSVGKQSLSRVDVVCGGSPCQNLSVAGNRKGLDGVESGLFFEMARVIDEIQPEVVVWENVPGALSSNQGRDFGVVLNTMADIGYFGAYRILDAQYFGVAQRRRRIFAVFSRGDPTGACCAEILALTESVSGYPASGRKTGKNAPSGASRGAPSGSRERDIAPALTQNYGKQPDDSDTGLGPMLIPVVANTIGDRIARSHTELDGHGAYIPILARTVSTCEGGRLDWETCTFVPVAAAFDHINVTSKTNRTRREFGSPANTLHQQGMSVIEATPIALRQNLQGDVFTSDVMPPIRSGATGGMNMPTVQIDMQVRRLTPTECERLQGFPDGHTKWGIDANERRVEMADTNRYRQLGNAVAVPCVQWIGRRIVERLVETDE